MDPFYLNNSDDSRQYYLKFVGKASEYFSIYIVNFLLTVVTFGFYYPWARAKKLQYFYGNTTLDGEHFHFAGTGKEMFKGFIKVIAFYIGIIVVFYLVLLGLNSILLAYLVFLLSSIVIVPLAVHGSFRYRMSRTSYRGIRFGYRGDRNELIKKFFIWGFLTVITLGIYGAWLAMNLRRYTHDNIRYGDVKFSNYCKGGEFFAINLLGYFLTILTFGIYIFWWQKNIFEFYINNLELNKDSKWINFISTATGGGFFNLLAVNAIINIFTLGIGKPWADVRTQKFIFDNISMGGTIDLNEVHQTEEEYKDAFGEDAMDFFEIDFA